MPAWLIPMRCIFNSIFKWVRCPGRHVQTRLVPRLMTIAAFDCEDALPVGAASQTEESMRLTVIASERRVARWVTIDTPRMHKHLVRFEERCACFAVVLYSNLRRYIFRPSPNTNYDNARADCDEKSCSQQSAESNGTIHFVLRHSGFFVISPYVIGATEGVKVSFNSC